MLTAALVSLSVVFVAELGDKSQLMTMTYALRHRWWVVLSGIGIASFMVHGLSVTIGHFLGLTLPGASDRVRRRDRLPAVRGLDVARRPSSSRDNDVPPVVAPRHVLLAVISSFVLAELGDKTMLATVALASDHNWAGVWIGATAGMVLADGVAIAVGVLLHKRLPEHFLHGLASVSVPAVRSVAAVRRRAWTAVGGPGGHRIGCGRRGDNRGRAPHPKTRRASARTAAP